jgi:membrane fusion protein, multidrug efflux system
MSELPPPPDPPPSEPVPIPVQVTPRPHSRLLRPALALLGVIILFIAWEILTSFVAYTDDAYVRSDLVALAPQVTGHLVVITVVDDQAVQRGDLLAKIDPEPFQLAVDAANASLQQADAEADAMRDSMAAAQDQLDAANALLPDAEATERRATALGSAGFASRKAQEDAFAALRDAQADVAAKQATRDSVQAQLAAKQAAVVLAKAQLASAQWQLARTVIRAPVDGIVNNLNLQIGDTAQADTPLIGIVAANSWRIIANYKQSYLSSLRPGDTAWIWLDAHPWRFYRARIRSIGRAISRQPGDNGLLPYVPPTTDWIRLQHRFPVTVDLVDPPAGLTLYMGADARCIVFP